MAFAATAFAVNAAMAASGVGFPVTVTVKDWTGKVVTTVRGVTFDGNFTLDTADHFNGKVDYVTAFDGGKVVKNGVSAERASSSIVTYGGISGPFETEVFVQPYVPISTGANIPDPYGVKDPTKSGSWVYTGTTGSSVKLSQTSSSTSFPNLYYDVANFSGNYKNAVWAPEIHYVRGNWYIYFSASDTSDTNRERSFVMSYKEANSSGLTSSANWNTATRLVTPDDKWAIDGTVFEGRDGKLYYVWSGWAGNSNVRQDIYLAPMDTPTSFETGAKRTLVSMPDQSWETQPTDHPLVEEGPAVLQKGNKTIIVFSGNGSWKQYYSLGYTVCSDGNYTTASSWKKHDGTVFTRRSHAYGPGHCSFTQDANGNDLIVYHATATATAPSGSDYWSIRDARIQPFAWHDDEPVFGAPCPTKGSGTPSGEAYDLTKSWTVDGSADKTFIHAPTAETVTGPSGTTVTPTFLGNDYFNIIGTTSLTEPKTVELTLVLKDSSKYAWDDGTSGSKTCSFTAKFSGEHVPSVKVVPQCADNSTAKVYANGVEVTDDPIAVLSNAMVSVVFEADDGYCFEDYAFVQTNTFRAVNDPTVVEGPLTIKIQPVTVKPHPTDFSTAKVFVNGVEVADDPIVVLSNAMVDVVFEADYGYCFADDHFTIRTNTVQATDNPTEVDGPKVLKIPSMSEEVAQQAGWKTETTLTVSTALKSGDATLDRAEYENACKYYGITPKTEPTAEDYKVVSKDAQVVNEGEIAVTKESIQAAKAETVEIVGGMVYLGVSVLSNSDITASTANWAPVKFTEDTQIGLSADGTKLVLPIPVAAQQGFMILQSGDAKAVPADGEASGFYMIKVVQ